MKKNNLIFFLLLIAVLSSVSKTNANPPSKGDGYFELRVYHFATSGQETSIDSFLQNQLVPSLHANRVDKVGVFKAIANDTSADKKVYVFIPYTSLKQWEKVSFFLRTNTAGDGGFINAAYSSPAFGRMESIFLKSFELMPELSSSKLTGPKSERVYELRSYESASPKIFRNKVQMFNQGGEIDLFSRLGFNAVFYSEVVFGSKMPNLMYMTSFENMKSRDEHWKTFSADPEWKTLSAKPEYQNNVQHIDITFLRPTEYSDL